jgi:CRP-like cAMP-binding protein
MTLRKRTPKADQLGSISLFNGCSAKDLQTLAGITTELSVRAGRVLCREGEMGHEFFVIVDGEASVDLNGKTVDTVGPGGFFGEMALLDGGARVATVTAATEMDLLVLSRKEFLALLDMTAISTTMLKSLGARLRRADDAIRPGAIGI